MRIYRFFRVDCKNVVLCHLKEQDEHKVKTDKGVQRLFRNGLPKTQ